MSKATCPGPLIWFSVGIPESAAILECAACGYIVIIGWFHDELHALTPVLREGFVS